MKQQTLEEATKQLYPIEHTGRMFMLNRDELNNQYKQEAFIEGAKWMQEMMYSEIDLELAFFKGKENSLTFIEWFKQFKKK